MLDTLLKNWKVVFTPQVMLAVFLGSGFLLLADGRLARVTQLMGLLGSWVVIAFFGSTAILLSIGLLAVWNWWQKRTRQLQLEKRRSKMMEDLTGPECAILAQFMATQSKTAKLDAGSGIVQGLVTKRMIYRASGIGEYGYGTCVMFDFNLSDWAYEMIMANPAQIENSLEEYAQWLDRQEGELP